MVSFSYLLVAAASLLAVQATPKPSCCAADNCFKSAKIPAAYTPIASEFCKKYIRSTPGTVTRTRTKTVTSTTVPVQSTATGAAPPATVTTTSSAPVCFTSTTANYATRTMYRVRGSDPPTLEAREAEAEAEPAAYRQPAVPSMLSKGCKPSSLPAKISSACKCFLTTKTITVTKTSTSTTTAATGAPTITTTVTPTVTSTETECVSTSTSTSIGGGVTCGVENPTAGAIGTPTCGNDNTPPGETNSPFRIEGGSEGNIFDGCIITGPRNITTSSGGTHLCDGTNNNANPAPGGTFTTDIDSAGRQEGFGFDGSYSNQFQDFFITAISNTAQSGNQIWRVLRNRVFTARDGCQEQVSPSDEALWAFDAVAPNRVFLSTSPGYQAVTQGTSTITVTILAGNPNSGNTIPAQGATFGQNGRTAGSDGSLIVDVPSAPGCYLFKAELSNAIRSNAFYLTVLADDQPAP